MDLNVLDNPIWHALANEHNKFSLGGHNAKRYPADVAPFAALRINTSQAFNELAATLDPGQAVALFTKAEPTLPRGWDVVRQRAIDQMMCTTVDESEKFQPVRLTPADVQEMMALAKLTEPGPFAEQTIAMGAFFGVRSVEGQLIAMAGTRLALPRFTEISAVCTHPDHAGKGYARALVAFLSKRVLNEGRIPFLHVKGENRAARVYERVGFTHRTSITLSVIANGHSDLHNESHEQG
jgi:predicted GNAT family acetyltransferase